MILFLSVLYFCLVFYSIYLGKNWRSFYARIGFHVSARFRYAVGSGRGDGAANFAELDSDFSEPGKHVWTFDMIGVLHVCVKGCAWHMSIGEYLVACEATTRVFQSYL